MADDPTIALECFGGPMDGQTMDLPVNFEDGATYKEAAVIHIDNKATPHYYCTQMHVDNDTQDVSYVLVYAGTSPYGVTEILRQQNSELADELEQKLDVIYEEADEDENL